MHSRFYRGAVVMLLLALAPLPSRAAPFVNLDFEQATVPPGTQIVLDASLAFPGWTARLNDTVLTHVYYDYFGIGEAAVVLYDTPNPGLGLPVYEGTYSAAVIGDVGQQFRASLAQAGDVPASSRSIRFLSNDAPPVVMIDGQELAVIRLTGGLPSDPAAYGADITGFGGTTVELRFVSPLPPNGVIAGVDAVSFSPEPIPEPSYLATVLVALCIHTRRCRRASIPAEGYHGPATGAHFSSDV